MADENRADPPVLNYGCFKPKRRIRFWFFWGVTGSGVMILGAMLVLSTSLCRSSETANRIKCASNLRQIGLAITQYANDHAGQFPDSLETILLNGDVTAAVFTCPSSNESPATGATTQEVVTDFRQPGRVSYLYLGRSFTSATVKPDSVLVYEPLTNHGDDGTNILFGDMHAEFYNRQGAKALLQNIQGAEAKTLIGGNN
jgi:hypothetical protein